MGWKEQEHWARPLLSLWFSCLPPGNLRSVSATRKTVPCAEFLGSPGLHLKAAPPKLSSAHLFWMPTGSKLKHSLFILCISPSLLYQFLPYNLEPCPDIFHIWKIPSPFSSLDPRLSLDTFQFWISIVFCDFWDFAAILWSWNCFLSFHTRTVSLTWKSDSVTFLLKTSEKRTGHVYNSWLKDKI